MLDYGAELIVIATGSAWRADGAQPGRADPRPGAGPSSPLVLTPEQVLAGHRPPGPAVVVYDADGYFMGPGLAELLASLPAKRLADRGIRAVHRIGDAVAPRMLSEVIFDAHRLARELDAPPAAAPRTYHREPPDLG